MAKEPRIHHYIPQLYLRGFVRYGVSSALVFATAESTAD
jgi:methylaspartate ammonia-lyase